MAASFFFFRNVGGLLDEILFFLSVFSDDAACEINLLDDELGKLFLRHFYKHLVCSVLEVK